MSDYSRGRLVARWGSWYGVPDAYHAIMPMLSGTAWKILTDLCYRSRSVDSLFPGMRGLQVSCGISSRESLTSAIDELVVATVLSVTRAKGLSNTYGLQLPTAPIRTNEAQAAAGQMTLQPGEVSVEERLARLAHARTLARKRKATPTTGATTGTATESGGAQTTEATTGTASLKVVHDGQTTVVQVEPWAHIGANHPAIKAWRQVTRRYPKRELYGYISKRLGTTPNIVRLQTIFEEWVARSHKPLNVSGILDVYQNGWRDAAPMRTPKSSNADRTRSAFDSLIGSGAEPESIDVRPIHAQ